MVILPAMDLLQFYAFSIMQFYGFFSCNFLHFYSTINRPSFDKDSEETLQSILDNLADEKIASLNKEDQPNKVDQAIWEEALKNAEKKVAGSKPSFFKKFTRP